MYVHLKSIQNQPQFLVPNQISMIQLYVHLQETSPIQLHGVISHRDIHKCTHNSTIHVVLLVVCLYKAVTEHHHTTNQSYNIPIRVHIVSDHREWSATVPLPVNIAFMPNLYCGILQTVLTQASLSTCILSTHTCIV